MFPILLTVLNGEENDLLGSIFEKYGRRMLRVAYNILQNTSDAEDAVGDTILAISDHISEFVGKSETEIIAMIHTYTKNMAINTYRKHKRESRHLVYDADVELEGVVDENSDPETVIVSDNVADTVYEIFRSLSESDQEILKMREMYKLSYSQIAELLEVSVDTVDSRIRRARKRLAEKAEKILN